MHEVVRMAMQPLIRQFFGRQVSKKSLQEWMIEVWQLLLGYVSIFHLLYGWLTFIFRSKS
jgi:hypothetical protein